MLNLKVGRQATVDGRSCIVTSSGQVGHAIYGNYDQLEPGRYAVEFNVDLDATHTSKADPLCAVLDVVTDVGRKVITSKKIYLSQLQAGRSTFSLVFDLPRQAQVECRAWVNGIIPLIIDDFRPIAPIPAAAADVEALLSSYRFPDEEAASIPFFAANRDMLRSLYERGIRVNVHRGAVVLTLGGVSLYVRSHDDLIFVGEIFEERAYNLRCGTPLCVIDIGMNIGLASLSFAHKSEVAEVHAFEPFPNTFDRASDNLALNPTLAAKIIATNVGLSDKDEEATITIDPQADSGALSTVGVAGGRPVRVTLQDAGRTLIPIIEDARQRGLKVVLKVDCEGSEFAIFRSLDRAGLLPKISAFMVEWHALFADKTQNDLIGPLADNGFVIFDRSPPHGNGFFYAARLG